MSHDLELNNGRYSFAYRGEGGWHRLGQDATNMTPDEMRDAAGFGFRVVKVPALAAWPLESGRALGETEFFFTAREDNGHVFCPVTAQYQLDGVQPADVWEWMQAHCDADPRFEIDAAGVLGNGGRLWAQARFCEDVTVAGDRHIPRALMSTSYDASQATRNEATMTRVVCQNTLRAAHMGSVALVKTRHSTKFNAEAVRREMAALVQTFEAYKAMGDAMARVRMDAANVLSFFGALLDIPADAAPKDISTRKRNIRDDLARAFVTTLRERNTMDGDAWTALQAVTRYVDHDRTVRGTDGSTDGLAAGRFDSGTFGSGDALKGKAMGLLLPMLPEREKVLVAA